MELLLEIYSHLPLLSRVCLALSCKGLHALFSSVLAANELRFPGVSTTLIMSGKCHRFCEDYHTRMMFLRNLENSKWAGCGVCQRLHLHQECDQFYFTSRFYETMRSGGWILPCLSLPARDRAHLVEYLRKPEADNRTRRFIDAGSFDPRSMLSVT